jgi:hypothetical protein
MGGKEEDAPKADLPALAPGTKRFDLSPADKVSN